MLALHLPLLIAIADFATPVTLFLAASKGQLHLGQRPLEVDPGRDQGQAAPLATTDEALDLVAVQEQLAGSLRIVVLSARRGVRRDVGIAQPHLATLDHGVRIAELRLALT